MILTEEQQERERKRIEDNERYMWKIFRDQLRESQMGAIARAYLRSLDPGTHV